MTKKQYCEIVIDDYCLRKRIKRKNLNDDLILEDTLLGIAMEYLNLLKSKEAKEYIKNKTGSLSLFYNPNSGKMEVMSVREFLNILPN